MRLFFIWTQIVRISQMCIRDSLTGYACRSDDPFCKFGRIENALR